MIDKSLLRLPGMKGLLPMLAGLALCQALAIIFQGIFLAQAIVHSWQQRSLAGLWRPLLLFALCFALRQVIGWSRQYIADRFAAQTARQLQQQLLSKLYTLGPAVVAADGTGNLVTMALDGIPETENYLALILNKSLNMAIIPWGIVAYVWWQNWLSGLILLLMFPVIILFMVILGLAAKAKSEQQYAGFQQMSNHFIDTLRGLKTLQLMGVSRQYAQNVYHVSEDYRKQTMGVLKIAMLSSFALDFFTTLAIAIVAVFLGIGLINGTIVLFKAMVTLILAPEYFMPIRDFGNDYHATLNGKNALTAIQTLLAQPTPQATTQLAPFETWGDQDGLQLQNVSFHYPDSQAGINDVTLNIHGGQKVAFIGASGSGKSTLLNLIGGFLTPNEGTVKVNDQEIPHLRQRAWQDHVSYIPQTPYLFAASILDNIQFYRPDATLSQVQVAAKAAGIASWIDSLEAGYDTLIGEGGRAVSGGQAQRIALARTLVDTNRSIWLFDEPTAHLDIETEAQLKATIVPLLADRLVFFATHRLHWLNQMDWVVVIDQGKIAAQGTPADLAEHSVIYQHLVKEMRGDFHEMVAK